MAEKTGQGRLPGQLAAAGQAGAMDEPAGLECTAGPDDAAASQLPRPPQGISHPIGGAADDAAGSRPLSPPEAGRTVRGPMAGGSVLAGHETDHGPGGAAGSHDPGNPKGTPGLCPGLQ